MKRKEKKVERKGEQGMEKRKREMKGKWNDEKGRVTSKKMERRKGKSISIRLLSSTLKVGLRNLLLGWRLTLSIPSSLCKFSQPYKKKMIE